MSTTRLPFAKLAEALELEPGVDITAVAQDSRGVVLYVTNQNPLVVDLAHLAKVTGAKGAVTTVGQNGDTLVILTDDKAKAGGTS